jgi:hypothetical protein
MAVTQPQTTQNTAIAPVQPARPAPSVPSFNPFAGNTVGTDVIIKSFGATHPEPAPTPKPR